MNGILPSRSQALIDDDFTVKGKVTLGVRTKHVH